jgi:hypothetical protein
MFFALCVKTVQGASLVATRGDGGHETGVSRKPGAGHLLCASSVDPRPPDAGSCWRQWRAWDDFLLLERELACIQERQMRLEQKGPAWNREQALLHQVVGYDMPFRPSAPQEGAFKEGAALGAFRYKKLSKLGGQ